MVFRSTICFEVTGLGVRGLKNINHARLLRPGRLESLTLKPPISIDSRLFDALGNFPDVVQVTGT